MRIEPPTTSEIDTRFQLSNQTIAWDIGIAVLMIAGLTSVGLALSTRSIILDVIGILGLCGSLLVFWGSFIEPRLITVNKKTIQLKDLHNATIAVVGDVHVGPFKRAGYVRRIVKRVNKLHPDLILLAGDFLFDSYADTAHLKPLSDLHAPLGVYAVLGNHDTGHMMNRTKDAFIPYRMIDRSNDVIATLEKCGIIMPRNKHVIMKHHDQSFALVCADHRLMKEYDIESVMKNVPDNLPTILLTHIPDVILDEPSMNADLIVCGHTHGGQIRLPFIGALHPIPDELGRAYDQGIFTLKNGTLLAITHGIGETMARARLFCPPEILILQAI